MSKKERIPVIADVTEAYIKYPASMQDGEKIAIFGLEKTSTIETDDGKTVIPKGGKTVTPLWGVSKEGLLAVLTKQQTDLATAAQAESDEKQSQIDNVTAIKN